MKLILKHIAFYLKFNLLSIQVQNKKLEDFIQNPSKTLLFVILIVFGANINAQIRIGDLHYRNDTTGKSFELSKAVHSSVKPYVISKTDLNHSSHLVIGSKVNSDSFVPNGKEKSRYRVYPLANLSAGLDNTKNLTYTAGLGLGVDYGKGKFFVTVKALPYFTKVNEVIDSVIQFSNTYPGAGQALSPNVFQNSELMAAFTINKFFTLLAGYGKNFFGLGYRSLLLSDNAAANPFFKIETSFSSIKYVNLYQVWRDIYQPTNQSQVNALKFTASHYLSWNITKNLNLSIFETVVMGGKDSLSNRGFDLNYLNPVVFYRPVEYSTGSADNVLLGINISYKTMENQTFYYQLILDEFLLSELQSGDKWWANKFGMQFGLKTKDFLIDDLYFQTEFNFVRPFTYSHKHSAQNYGHLNAPAAHPIGANFYELLNIISYKKGKHLFTNKITYSAYGIDSSEVNYGQNIFHSYADRYGNYGHEILQGLKTNVFNNHLIYEYPILTKLNLFVTAQYNFRFEINKYHTYTNHLFQIGLKSRIWNRYTDF
jgi:hypothetical protein